MTSHPAAYVRKSKRLEESAAAQLAAIKEVAARDGVNGDLVVYSDVGVSGRYGKRGARSAWAQLQEDIDASRVSAVYLSVLDRAGRSLEEWLAFARRCRDAGVRIVDQTGQDRAADEGYDLTVMEMLFAEREGKKAVQRAARGQVTKAARGDKEGVPPYGQMITRDDAGRVIHVANPAEPLEPVLDAVRATGGNVLAACRALNEAGVPARRAAWSPRSLTKVVRREDPRLLHHLAKPRKARGRDELLAPAPLAKLVRCHCGRVMTPRPRSGSLYCYGGIQRGPGHQAGERYVARERFIYDLLRAELPRIKRIDILKRPKAGAEDAATQRATLERRRRLLGIALADETIDEAEYASRKQAIDQQLAAIEDVDADWLGFGEPRLLVDFDGDPQALGEALRQRVRAVHLDKNMLPVRVELRGGRS